MAPSIPAKVLLPLYIYPLTDRTWQPLYDAIAAHPNVHFVVVVNPNSGPGDQALPGPDYVREVPRLNAFPNVTTVGYIRIHYCEKALSATFAEIERYAGWDRHHAVEIPGLHVQGILVDETPNHHTAHRAQYLEALRQGIKATQGLLGDKLIIHNPGTPPDASLAHPGPDVIVSSEEPYDKHQRPDIQKRLRDYHYEQPRSAYMISGVPRAEVAAFTRTVRDRAAYLFVTDLVDDFYESFGDSWPEFVAAMEPGTNAEAGSATKGA